MFTARNAVLIALGQVGVIVAGSLAMGVSHRYCTHLGMELPLASHFLLQSGVLLFLLPLVWICAAMSLRGNSGISEDLKHLVFLLGTGLLVFLILFELYAILTPWLHACFLEFGTGVEFNE